MAAIANQSYSYAGPIHLPFTMTDYLEYQEDGASLQEREAVALEMLTCLDQPVLHATYAPKPTLAATINLTSGLVPYFTLYPIRVPARRLMIWDVVPVAYLAYFGDLKPVQRNRHLLELGCYDFGLSPAGVQYFACPQRYNELLQFVQKVVHIEHA